MQTTQTTGVNFYSIFEQLEEYWVSDAPVVHKLAFMDIVNRLRTRYIAKTIASTMIFCSKYCGLSFVLYVEICIFLEVATDV